MIEGDPRPEDKVFDFEVALDRLAGRTAYLRKVVGRFIDDSPSQFEQLSRALSDQAFDEARRIAHGLSGAASMVGASGVGRTALALETALKNSHRDGLSVLHQDLLAEFDSFKSTIAVFAWPANG